MGVIDNLFNLLKLITVLHILSTVLFPVELSVSEAIEMALKQNNSYRATLLDPLIAGTEEITASLFYNPVIDASYNMQPLDSGQQNNPREYRISISQGFQPRGLRAAKKKQAQTLYSSAIIYLEDYKRKLKWHVKLLCNNIFFSNKTLSFGNVFYNNYLELIKANEIRYKKGEISDYELKKLKQEEIRFQNALILKKIENNRLISNLKTLLGLKQEESITIVENETEIQNENFDEEIKTDINLQKRSDIMLSKKNVEFSEKQLEVAKKEANTNFSVSMSYHYEPHTAYFNSNHYVSMGISIPFKMFNRNQGLIKGYRLEKQKSQLEYEQNLINANNEIAILKESILNYKTHIANFKEKLELSREIYEKGRLLYRKNAVNIIHLLESERAFFETQQQFYEIIYNYRELYLTYNSLTETIEKEK